MSERDRFLVGVNYPWRACGHDFGPRPRPWRGAGPTDWAAVEQDLKDLEALGVQVARWWVLAGGVNLPVGRPLRGPMIPWLGMTPGRGGWLRGTIEAARTGRLPRRYAIAGPTPTWPRASLDDFAALLGACRAAGVRLLPSLVSFELFLPVEVQAGGVRSRGRAGYAVPGRRRAERFFDRLLEPLLEVSGAFRDAIYAWEVINEPHWAVRLLPQGWAGPRGWVRPDAMSAFIRLGVERIAARGFLATVGFIHGELPWLAPATTAALRRLAADGRYVHQMHHYPGLWVPPRPLPPAASLAVAPCLVGELPTSRHQAWPDEGLREGDPERYLAARLAAARRAGYAGALLWSVRGRDKHSAFGPAVRRQVEAFTRSAVG
ncbi:MAG: hypothetical protein ACFCGT_10440 [Sandaracinaceae bacterium]